MPVELVVLVVVVLLTAFGGGRLFVLGFFGILLLSSFFLLCRLVFSIHWPKTGYCTVWWVEVREYGMYMHLECRMIVRGILQVKRSLSCG